MTLTSGAFLSQKGNKRHELHRTILLAALENGTANKQGQVSKLIFENDAI